MSLSPIIGVSVTGTDQGGYGRINFSGSVMSSSQDGDTITIRVRDFNTPEDIAAENLTGFHDRTTNAITWVDGTRTLSVAPSGTASFEVFVNNQKYTYSTTQSFTIPNTVGENFIYFNASGTLTGSTAPWSVSSDQIAPLATVYWDGNDGAVGDERHNAWRNRITHAYLHNTRGTAYDSGLSGSFASASFNIDTGIIWDEDIKFDITAKTIARIWYRSGSLMVHTTGTTPYVAISGAIQYDNAGALAAVPVSNYVVNWVYATNEATYPIYIVVGQAQYGTLGNARLATLPTFPNITTREWKLLYSVIYRNAAGTITFIESADYRSVSNLPNNTAATSLPASSITFTPGGNLVATNVQSALVELDDEKVAKAGDVMTGALSGTALSMSSGATVGTLTASGTISAGGVISTNLGAALSANVQAGPAGAFYNGGSATTNITSIVADGASAVSIKLGSFNALTGTNAKIVSIRNNEIEKASIDKDGKFSGFGADFASASSIASNSKFAHDGVTAKKWILGEQNLIYNSTNITSSAWTATGAYGNWLGLSASGSASDAFGGTTAAKLSLPTTPTMGWSTANSPYQVCSVGETYTFSAYLKNGSGSLTTVWLSIHEGIGGVYTGQGSSGATVTTTWSTSSWTRYSVTRTVTSGTQLQVGVGTNNTTGTGDFYMCAPQLERGSVATPYVPTAGTPLDGFVFDNTGVANTTAQKLLSVRYSGSDKLTVDVNGRLFVGGGTSYIQVIGDIWSFPTLNYTPTFNNGTVQGISGIYSYAGASMTIRSAQADTTSHTGTITDTSVAITSSGAKLLSIRNGTVEKAYISKDGLGAFRGGANIYQGSDLGFGWSGDAALATSSIYWWDGSTNGSWIKHPSQYTITVGTNGAERLRIDASGSVGINDTTPSASARFSIKHDSGGTPALKINNTAAGTWISLSGTTGQDALIDSNAGFNLRVSGTTSKVYISSSGWVGINTTAPTSQLSVNGLVTVTGALIATTSVATDAITGRTTTPFTVTSYASNAQGTGTIIDTGNNFTTGGTKLLSIRNSGSEKAYIDLVGGISGTWVGAPIAAAATSSISSGTYSIVVNYGGHLASFLSGATEQAYVATNGDLSARNIISNGGGFMPNSSNPLYLWPQQAEVSGTTVGVIINTPAYVSATSKILSVRNNSNEKLSLDYNGNLWTYGSASFLSAFTSYVGDGLFGATAGPTRVRTPNGTNSTLIGYTDDGAGSYVPRIGFYQVSAGNVTASNTSIGNEINGDMTINGGPSNTERIRIRRTGAVAITGNLDVNGSVSGTSIAATSITGTTVTGSTALFTTVTGTNTSGTTARFTAITGTTVTGTTALFTSVTGTSISGGATALTTLTVNGALTASSGIRASYLSSSGDVSLGGGSTANIISLTLGSATPVQIQNGLVTISPTMSLGGPVTPAGGTSSLYFKTNVPAASTAGGYLFDTTNNITSGSIVRVLNSGNQVAYVDYAGSASFAGLFGTPVKVSNILTTSGTATSATYLRGDGVWAAAGGGSTSSYGASGSVLRSDGTGNGVGNTALYFNESSYLLSIADVPNNIDVVVGKQNVFSTANIVVKAHTAPLTLITDTSEIHMSDGDYKALTAYVPVGSSGTQHVAINKLRFNSFTPSVSASGDMWWDNASLHFNDGYNVHDVVYNHLLANDPAFGHAYVVGYSSSLVSYETWTSGSTLVKRKDYTYSGSLVSTEVTKIYSPTNGTTIVAQTTNTYTYSSGVLTGSTLVRSI